MRVKDDVLPHREPETEKPAPKPYCWGLAVCSFLGCAAGVLLHRQGLFSADGSISGALFEMVQQQNWLEIFGCCYFVLFAQASLLLAVGLCCLGGLILPLIFGVYGGALLYLVLDAACMSQQWSSLYWLMLWLPAVTAYTALTVFAAGGCREAAILWQNLFHPGKGWFSYKSTLTRYFYTVFALALASGMMAALGYLILILG